MVGVRRGNKLEKPTGSSVPGCLLRTSTVHKGNTTGLVLFDVGVEARSPLWKVRSGTGIIPPGWCPLWYRGKGTIIPLKTLTFHRYTLRCRSPLHTTGLVSILLGPGVEGNSEIHNWYTWESFLPFFSNTDSYFRGFNHNPVVAADWLDNSRPP